MHQSTKSWCNGWRGTPLLLRRAGGSRSWRTDDDLLRNAATSKVGLFKSFSRVQSMRCGPVHGTSTLNPSRMLEPFCRKNPVQKKSKWTNTRVSEKRCEIFASQKEMHAAPLASLYHCQRRVHKVEGDHPICGKGLSLVGFGYIKAIQYFLLSILILRQRHKKYN